MGGENAQLEYVIVVQCARVTGEVCPGFLCEHAFYQRKDAFACYPADRRMHYLAFSCGGCPGTGTLRKLMNVEKNLKKREGLTKSNAVVHLSTCITRSNHHGPRCPHCDCIKGQIERAGFVCREDSRISPLAEKHRAEGLYGEKA